MKVLTEQDVHTAIAEVEPIYKTTVEMRSITALISNCYHSALIDLPTSEQNVVGVVIELDDRAEYWERNYEDLHRP